ncbi:MAG TPA: hypothetical protein VMY36_01835 [Patescibacteria group bacterium]|nr:hypothetical protein [Patescibacteria group bacterium]
MKEMELLWADQDHISVWGDHFKCLEQSGKFQITKLDSIEDEEILKNCEGKNAVIIHSGTLRPMAGLKGLLQEIRAGNPEIKIGLETNIVHPILEGLVDFYIDKPITVEDLEELLREKIGTKSIINPK